MFVVDDYVSLMYQTDNSNLLKRFFIQFLIPKKMSNCYEFYHNSSEGKKLLHESGKKWLLSKALVSSIFDLLVSP